MTLFRFRLTKMPSSNDLITKFRINYYCHLFHLLRIIRAFVLFVSIRVICDLSHSGNSWTAQFVRTRAALDPLGLRRPEVLRDYLERGQHFCLFSQGRLRLFAVEHLHVINQNIGSSFLLAVFTFILVDMQPSLNCHGSAFL